MSNPLRDPFGRAVLLRGLLLVALVAAFARLGWAAGLAAGALGSLLLGAWTVQRIAPLKRRILELATEEHGVRETPEHTIADLAARVLEVREHLAKERRRVEHERDDLLGILEATSEGILVLGHNHRVEMINAAARRLLSTPANPLGRSLPEIVRVPELLDYAEALRCGDVLGPRTIELPDPRGRSGGDRARTISLSGALVHGHHLRNRAVLVLHDLTELSRLESVRTDFVANATHEMRSPLASILGYAETLAAHQDLTDAEARDYLERILRNSHRLDDLIRDLIELSRLEHAQASELDNTDVPALLREIQAAFADPARDKGIDFELESGSLSPVVQLDAGLLRQALTNLVDNAVKYTPPGGRILIAAHMRGEDHLIIAVSDTGPGIPREHQGRIFERFYRVDTARSRSLGGTGLGLAIVKHAIALHGGQVELESSEAGTTFRVVVPVRPGA